MKTLELGKSLQFIEAILQRQSTCSESQKMTEIKAILFPLYKAGHIIYAVTIKAYDKIKKSHTTQ